jgi:cysteine desulfurase family protein
MARMRANLFSMTHFSYHSPDMTPRRLYMDNAATSFPKPREVLGAVNHYMRDIGASAGRGAYREALESASLLNECRRRLCKMLHGQRPEHFIFTLNCTDALNLAIKGLIDPTARSHVICTEIDHNSVLRPIQAMVERGWVEQTIVKIDPSTGLVDPQDIRKAIRSGTKFIAVAHASNVIGTVQDIRRIGAIARENAVPFIVDAAQSAGHLPIDLQADNIDLLAAPGHKALLGPLGTGFLYIRPGLEKLLRTTREGGTGSISEEPRQPEIMPDRFESGSHNAVGIAALSEGVAWIMQQGIEHLAAHDQDLVRTFIEGISNIDGLKYFGPQGVKDRIGVFSVKIEGLDAHELSSILEASYGILTRPGIHCAPLVHRAIGTMESGGTTRFSFGPFLTRQDVKFATDVLAEVASGVHA